MIECKLCQKPFNNYNGLAKHIYNNHRDQYDRKKYYDTFILSDDDNFCKTCGNETTFRDIGKGYLKYCSEKCRSENPEVREKIRLSKIGKKQSKETISKRIRNTDQKTKEENRIKSLREKYGNDIINPSQIPLHKDKCRETSLKNWGTEHPSQNSKIFKKITFNKKIIKIEGFEFTNIQGYEDMFLKDLKKIYPYIKYEDLLEIRENPIKRPNGKIHFPDFYSKKHNHIFEIKSRWTFEKNKQDVLSKKKDAESLGYKYTIIIYERRGSSPIILD
jgi:hypothetical protein